MTDDEFSEIWTELYPRLFKYCQFRCSCLPDAEEVAAESFARLYQRGPSDRSVVLPWLYRVATNLSIDRHRRRRRETPFEPGLVDGPAASQWRDDTVWESVSRLRKLEQLVIYLRLVEDLPFADVSSITGRSEGACRVVFQRSLKKLRTTLEGVPRE